MRRADLQNAPESTRPIDALRVRIRAASIRKRLLARNSVDSVIGELALNMSDLELCALADAEHQRNLDWRARKALQK